MSENWKQKFLTKVMNTVVNKVVDMSFEQYLLKKKL